MDDGIDDISQKAGGFDAGLASDDQDGGGCVGDHGEGEPIDEGVCGWFGDGERFCQVLGKIGIGKCGGG